MTMHLTIQGAMLPGTVVASVSHPGMHMVPVVITQTSGPPPLQGSSTSGAKGIAMEPGGGNQGAQEQPQGFGFQPILILLVVFGAIILFSTMGQRKEKKRRAQMLGQLKKNDSVQTIGGIIGSVVEVKNETVVLRVDDRSDIRVTVSRAAVQQVLSTQDATQDD